MGEEGGSREGLRWLVSVNTNTCGAKAGEIPRGSLATVLVLVSSVAKSSGFVCRASHKSLQTMIVIGNSCFSSLFLSLCVSALPVNEWGETVMGPSYGAPKAGEAGCSLHPLLLSWLGELFLAGKFSLDPEQCWLEEWDNAGKMKLSSFSSHKVILRFLFHCVAEVS